jgi:leucyl aminopeptidase
VHSKEWDGLLLVTDSTKHLTGPLEFLKAPIEQAKELDGAVGKEVTLIGVTGLSSKRLIYSPTGPVNRDYDDVRRYSDAANKGIKRAMKAGCKSPLLVVPSGYPFTQAWLVSALGAMHALYAPLEIREDVPERAQKVDKLGLWSEKEDPGIKGAQLTAGLESGRFVARDIGGSDPERMAAPRVAEYVVHNFANTVVQVKVYSDLAVLQRCYPLLCAVNRCASIIGRHAARVIELEYVGEGATDLTLFLVGKGVTYDTGGADIKAGGVMAGMHRDKCGAAAVAGFFQVLSILKPKGIRVVGYMSMVRNSVGTDCYVADEIIISRAGVRVRVGNTDAEGRMAMGDVLCHAKERALLEPNQTHLVTIATLTGHAIRAMGPAYSIVLDNGPATKLGTAKGMQSAGDMMGDPFEISTIRREDYDFVAGKSEYEDVLQANNQPSSNTPRGHQYPAAFLIRASGLDKHGIDSDKPLPYSHMDIAGSSGPFPGVPTGAPVVALAAHFLLGRF